MTARRRSQRSVRGKHDRYCFPSTRSCSFSRTSASKPNRLESRSMRTASLVACQKLDPTHYQYPLFDDSTTSNKDLLNFSHDALDRPSSLFGSGTLKLHAPGVFCRKESLEASLKGPSHCKKHWLHRLFEIYHELGSQDKQWEACHIQTLDVF